MARDFDGRGVADEAQWERAHQAWSLIVDTDSEELSPEQRRELLRTLRVKRAERPAFFTALPGMVRRGARVDLEPACLTLKAAGIKTRLERRTDLDRPEERDLNFRGDKG